MQNLTGIPLGSCPTPLQELPRLSQQLGGNRRLWLKRDDLLGIGFGGNKIRKFSWLLADARRQKADLILTGGGRLSNQPLAAAACCAAAGLPLRLVLPLNAGPQEETLIRAFGAELIRVPDSSGIPAALTAARKQALAEGHHPYVIRPGAPEPVGILGYVDCAKEIAVQVRQLGLQPGHILCAGGTGGTYAGLVLGSHLVLPEWKVIAAAAGKRFAHPETLCRKALQAAAIAGYEVLLKPEDFEIHFAGGPGASRPSRKGSEALQQLAASEGILLDPLFTGKALAVLFRLNDAGYFAAGEDIILIHTGGTVSLLNSCLSRKQEE